MTCHHIGLFAVVRRTSVIFFAAEPAAMVAIIDGRARVFIYPLCTRLSIEAGVGDVQLSAEEPLGPFRTARLISMTWR